jgi:hypothetical protein
LSNEFDPRAPQETTLTIVIAGLLAVIGTLAVLYISGTIGI